MTDATNFIAFPPITGDKPAGIPLRAHVLFSAPVLICDCVNPLAGETLLSHLWKRMDPAADLQD
jgi:hypothetical protein